MPEYPHPDDLLGKELSVHPKGHAEKQARDRQLVQAGLAAEQYVKELVSLYQRPPDNAAYSKAMAAFIAQTCNALELELELPEPSSTQMPLKTQTTPIQ